MKYHKSIENGNTRKVITINLLYVYVLYIFIRMRRYLTLDTIDILCLVYSNSYSNKEIFKYYFISSEV